MDLVESENGLLSLLRLYIERFGDKPCCFEDLKPYAVLEGEELAKLTSFLDGLEHSSVSSTTTSQGVTVDGYAGVSIGLAAVYQCLQAPTVSTRHG